MLAPDEPPVLQQLAAGAAADGAAAAPPWAADRTPTGLPRRYAFLYGDELAYFAQVHDHVTREGGRGFGCWRAVVEATPGHIFSLTFAQFRQLEELFPPHIARASVLARVAGDGWAAGGGWEIACSTWLDAAAVPAPAPAPAPGAAVSAGGSGGGERAATAGFKRSLGSCSFGSRSSIGSDMFSSFGSEGLRLSATAMDLLPEMGAAGPGLGLAAAEGGTGGAGGRGAGAKKKGASACPEEKAAAARRAVMDCGLLPRGKDGRPKPTPPWIAAAICVAATSDHPGLAAISVTPASADGATPASFKIVSRSGSGGSGLDSGVVLTRWVLEVVKLAGSPVRLPGWDALRKHLSPTWCAPKPPDSFQPNAPRSRREGWLCCAGGQTRREAAIDLVTSARLTSSGWRDRSGRRRRSCSGCIQR